MNSHSTYKSGAQATVERAKDRGGLCCIELGKVDIFLGPLRAHKCVPCLFIDIHCATS